MGNMDDKALGRQIVKLVAEMADEIVIDNHTTTHTFSPRTQAALGKKVRELVERKLK